jgi:exodeoxyribonuclease III
LPGEQAHATILGMKFRLATWNINSVRLRIGLVEKLLTEHQPDVLCLQETKCPQGQFPSSSLHELGYKHIAEFGQKGYHGVAIVSRLPFTSQHSRDFCKKGDCRHVSVKFEGKSPITLHNLYVPAGGDEPDREINEKFGHKLDFLDEMEAWSKSHAIPKGEDAIIVGDLNVAPLEHDVWSHKALLKIVSHTPVETERFAKIMQAGNWVDVMRGHVPPEEKLYTWWSYRAKDWAAANKGRRLDHVLATENLAKKAKRLQVLKEARGWTQTSDHVPVMVDFG